HPATIRSRNPVKAWGFDAATIRCRAMQRIAPSQGWSARMSTGRAPDCPRIDREMTVEALMPILDQIEACTVPDGWQSWPVAAKNAVHRRRQYRPASVRSVLGQLALALKMAAISASDISSGCFLVCSLRSIHNPASLACAVLAVTMAAG